MPAYKDENTGKWFVKCYYTDYTGTKRQKKKRGFDFQRDAKEWESDFLSRMAAQPSMTFNTLAALYLEDAKANLKEISYKTKKDRVTAWILPYFGEKPLDEITAADVRKWESEMKTAVSPQKGTQLSPGYLNNIFMELSSVFNFAVRFYGLSVNPCHVAGNTMGKRNRSMNFWTKAEFDAFIATFDCADPFYTAFLVLYYCGLRIGELQALTVGDVDADAATLTVNKTLHLLHGENVITPPKTQKSNRVIIMPRFLVECLERHTARLYEPQSDTRIFTAAASSYAKRLDRHAAEAGVKRIRIHDIRHSNASLLIEMGFSALLVSERLGHENVSTTLNIYSHLFPSKQSEVAEKLDALCKDDNY